MPAWARTSSHVMPAWDSAVAGIYGCGLPYFPSFPLDGKSRIDFIEIKDSTTQSELMQSISTKSKEPKDQGRHQGHTALGLGSMCLVYG